MKMLATKMLALCLLVALQKRNVIGIDENTGQSSGKNSLENDFESDPAVLERISNESFREENEYVVVDFRAFGKHFIAALHPERAIFADVAEVTVHDEMGSKTIPIGKHYGGHLVGQTNTTVVGSFTRGVFDGVIFTHEDDYFVEPADRYLPPNPHFNAVVSKTSDTLLTSYPENATFAMVTVSKRLGWTVEGKRSEDGSPRHVCNVRVAVDAVRDTADTIALVHYYVAAADAIFHGTDFDGDGRGGDVGLAISAIDVFVAGSAVLRSPDLDLMCAGLLLTRQTRPDNSTDACICAPGGSNVAEVSLQSPRDTAATVVHQFGHLFGSPDDDSFRDHRCLSEEPDRRFAMSPNGPGRMTGFSECSRRSIGRFLGKVVAQGGCLATRAARHLDVSGTTPVAEMATPEPEVADNELPDGWGELLAAKGSKQQAKKVGKKVGKKGPKPQPIKTTAAPPVAAPSTAPPAASPATAPPAAAPTTAPLAAPSTAPPAAAPATAPPAAAPTTAPTTTPTTTTKSVPTTKKKNTAASIGPRPVFKRPLQVMTATLVTFVTVGFRIFD